MKTYQEFMEESFKAAIAGAVAYHAFDLLRGHIKKKIKRKFQKKKNAHKT